MKFREAKTLDVFQAQAGVRTRTLTPERLDPSSPSPQRAFSLCGRGTAFGPASQSRSWSLCPQPQTLPAHPLWLLEGKVPSLIAELPFLTAVLISSGAVFTSVVTQRHTRQTTVPLRRISPVLPSLLRFGLLLPREQGESLLG